jgi:hypothetical protein
VTLPESSTASGTILYYVIYRSDWQDNESFVYVNSGFENSVESQILSPGHQFFQNSLNLTGIPDGNHSITITAVAGGFYPANNRDYPSFFRFMINGSSSVYFTTNALPPDISVLTIENKTYATTDLALNFTINEETSQVTYSLDGEKNITIAGNNTLTGLSNGDHNLSVYAIDEAGNVGVPKIINFIVEVPEPYPTLLVATTSGVSAIVIVCVA